MKLILCPCCKTNRTEPETLCEPCCELEVDAWLEALAKPSFAKAISEDLLGQVAMGLSNEDGLAHAVASL